MIKIIPLLQKYLGQQTLLAKFYFSSQETTATI
jgi:hypothetical protein